MLGSQGHPVSRVDSLARFECSSSGLHQTRSYVDGLGRARASLIRTDWSAGGVTRRWEQSGVTMFTPRGAPNHAFNNGYVSTDPPPDELAISIPSTPFIQTLYDAFDRPDMVIERDSAMSHVEYGALTTRNFDPLDNNGDAHFLDTPSITRVDGHGRTIEQVLINARPGDVMGGTEIYRLDTTYRQDGAVTEVRRSQVASRDAQAAVVAGRTISRTFTYDSLGRRLGTVDPDSRSYTSSDPATQNWRYLFNRVGDLVAVRDPRGCGQNFFYDLAGRLVAEEYVSCAEAQDSGTEPSTPLPAGSIALGAASGVGPVDVLYEFDQRPLWVTTPAPANPGYLLGRLTGTSDRGQRGAIDYDVRGRPIQSIRQVAMLSAPQETAYTINGNDPASELLDDTPGSITMLEYDPVEYVTTSIYDRIDRAVDVTLPTDPDWALFENAINPPIGPTAAPVVRGTVRHTLRGLPALAYLHLDGVEHHVWRAYFNEHRQAYARSIGTFDFYGAGGAGREVIVHVDERTRPRWTRLTRTATSTIPESLGANTRPLDTHMNWDEADNLVSFAESTLIDQFPDEQKPHWVDIQHDALYRVAQLDYRYHVVQGTFSTELLPYSNWRQGYLDNQAVDPMRREPAPLVPAAPAYRPVQMQYQYDWLANQTQWSDDQSVFYERSLGRADQSSIANGFEESARPTALYLATNIRDVDDGNNTAAIRGGWVDLDYGESGNVISMTVRGSCRDPNGSTSCYDDSNLDETARAQHLRDSCICDNEQHYRYRWDELNRLNEARRWDRDGTGNWVLQVRQRYRYDAANGRTVKITRDDFSSPGQGGTDGLARAALYIEPGRFERRGLEPDFINDEYDGSLALGTETIYNVNGAKIVWKPGNSAGSTGFERDARMTYNITDYLGSTGAVVDLVSNELLEYTTWLPSGVRETHRINDELNDWALEPYGFTSKEGDDEVGLIYFGHRYLMPHLGRWASPDPLQIHAGGGGEFGNSYHYVAGNLLQAVDPDGLDMSRVTDDDGNAVSTSDGTPVWQAEYENEDGEQVSLGTCTDTQGACLERFRDDAFNRGLRQPFEAIGTSLEVLADVDSHPAIARDLLMQALTNPGRLLVRFGEGSFRTALATLRSIAVATMTSDKIDAAYANGQVLAEAAMTIFGAAAGRAVGTAARAAGGVIRRLPAGAGRTPPRGPPPRGGSGGVAGGGSGSPDPRPVYAVRENGAEVVGHSLGGSRQRAGARYIDNSVSLPDFADSLGYSQRRRPRQLPFNSHGQDAFWNGRQYITRDVDSHRGGFWKVFDRRGNRVGTFNRDLTERIGD